MCAHSCLRSTRVHITLRVPIHKLGVAGFFFCVVVRLRISNVCSQVYNSSGKIYLYGNGLPERMKRAPSESACILCTQLHLKIHHHPPSASLATIRSRGSIHYVYVFVSILALGCYKDIVCTLSDFAMAHGTHIHTHSHTLTHCIWYLAVIFYTS